MKSLSAAIALVALCVVDGVAARVIHSETSLYQTILITEDGSLRCLQFSVRKDRHNQSCRDSNDPQRLVFQYTQTMLATTLLLDSSPQNILIVGLGGGTLPTALAELYPNAHIDVVEIDPAVAKVARNYFDFAPGSNTRVYEQDARVWTKRALARPLRYDLIMLDAFNGDYIPEHLMTREYLEEIRGLLTQTGTLAANTFSTSRLYDSESVTYASVFGAFFNVRSEGSNRIIVVNHAALPSRTALDATARNLAGTLKPYGIAIERYPAMMATKPDWDTTARVLTDQYSPANLLKGQ